MTITTRGNMTQGRPTEYSNKLADTICAAISEGNTLNNLGKDDRFPSKQTMYTYLDKYPYFFDAYTRARIKRADSRADRIDEYVDKVLNKEITPDMARVIIDAEKWQSAHEQPKRYGAALTHRGDPENPMVTKDVSTSDRGILQHFIKNYAPRADGFTQEQIDNGEDLV